MRVYRKKINKDGETITIRKWYADVHLSGGKRYGLPLFENEKLSRDFAADLETMLAQYERGGSYDKHIERWLSQLSTAMLSKFTQMGLISTVRVAAGSSLNKHLDDWQAALIDGGAGKAYANQKRQRAERVFREGGFRSLNDISGDKAMAAIGRLQATVYRTNPKTNKVELSETGPAASYSKLHHLRAVKQFAKWCVVNGRMAGDPLIHLSPKNVRVENQRRALSTDEIEYLLSYTATAPSSWNIPGPERALVYELAVSTGLRRDEIKSLKRTSFDFERLTVKVEAQHSKNRKPALLPVKAALMDKLKRHLSGKLPMAAAFAVPQSAAKMLKKDMEKARKAWTEAVKDNPKEHRRRGGSDFLKVETYQGKADFHCLRHTFGTLLAENGVHPKVAMDLMRHSDINLTLSLYTHGNKEQGTAAINALPSFGQKPKQRKNKKA